MNSKIPTNNVWVADLGDGMYRNPILYSDYSDPDAIRVGDDYFMTASSFAHMPGLPILHSKDMVNWKLVNYVIDKLDLPGYDKPQHGKGVWAPSIRYHDGKFWVFFSTPDEGIFMSTTEDPFGRWAPLHCIKEAKGLIDPCPFWDDDGNAYLVHAYAFSRSGIKHKLNLCRMSPDGRTLLDEGRLIFDGSEHHPTMEGPKMYKRNGYYYVFAPAGGVPTGWQTILRSKEIYGLYEDKIVLHQGDTPVNGPHQGAWVESAAGESWFIHFQDQDAYGRIVHLQPMDWENDWPVMGEDINGDGIGEPVLRWRKPVVSGDSPTVPATSDDFAADRLGLQWQWQANPRAEWYSLTENKGQLRLYPVSLPKGSTTLYEAPHLLMQKFPAPTFTATAKLSFYPEEDGDSAGLVVFGLRYRYLAISRNAESRFYLRLVHGELNKEVCSETVVAEIDVDSSDVLMRVTVEGDAECRFSYSMDGDRFLSIGDAFQAKEGRWVGAKVGVFAVNSEGAESWGYADYDWFKVRELPER